VKEVSLAKPKAVEKSLAEKPIAQT